jgi:hypothetical protein
VDRCDRRRRLMVIVDVTRAVIIAGLAAAILTHGAGLALIYLTAIERFFARARDGSGCSP